MENYRVQKNEKAVIASYKGPRGKVPWISSLGKHEERIKKEKERRKQKRKSGGRERERGEEKSKRERETDRMRGRERIRNRAELSRPRRLREARVRRSLARFPILPKTTDFGTDIDSRRRYRHTPAFSGCPTRVRNERGWESIAARNNLQPFRA